MKVPGSSQLSRVMVGGVTWRGLENLVRVPHVLAGQP